MIDAEWMELVYGGVDGNVEVRCFKEGEQPWRRFGSDWNAAMLAAMELDGVEGWNIYAGIATRAGNDGSKAGVAMLRALWVDFDEVGNGAEDALDAAMSTFLPPSIRVFSGGGYHLYWIFEEPVPVDTEARRTWIEEALKGLQLHFHGDNKVVDVARIMRIPGTANWPDQKKRDKGRTMSESSVLEMPGHLYQPRDFADMANRGRAERARSQGEVSITLPTDLPSSVQSVIEGSPRVRGLFLHDPGALPKNRKNADDLSGSVFDYHLMRELLKHPVVTKTAAIQACQIARVRSGEDAAKAKRQEYWDRTYKAALAASRQGEVSVNPNDPAAMLRSYLRNPAQGRASAIDPRPLTAKIELTPRYPSGIAQVDQSAMEGLYGLTAIGGPKNVGKSVFLMNVALSAAMSGEWVVCIFDAENADNVWNRRVLRWFGEPMPVVQQQLRNLHRHFIHAGVTFEDLREWACAMIGPDTRRLLIVFDSLNTILDKMAFASDDGNNYWRTYKDILLWCQDVRVATEGSIAFVMASELNKAGTMAGGKIDFTVDCEILVRNHGDELAVKIEKSRETKKPDLPDMVITDTFHLVPSDSIDESEGDDASDDDDRGTGNWWQQ